MDDPYDNLSPFRYEKGEPEPSRRRTGLFAAVIAAYGVLAIGILAYASWPPGGFPSGQVVSISPGASLDQAATELYRKGVIRSVGLFKAVSIAVSGEGGIKAGQYLFSGPELMPEVAWRLSRGEEGLAPIKVTIPEGYTVRQISDALGTGIPGFATSTFLSLASTSEGYLFPDTYFFTLDTTPSLAIGAMRGLFGEKIGSEAAAIAASGRATSSILIMASLLEREATSSSDRRLIAGILWKRLDQGSPLDVDAALAYALNKSGAKLTSADLASGSPYNTYKNVGLPPTPISNPGLSAIEDALNPTPTDYWYYLSDSNGTIHYAKTYQGQLANEAKYL